MIQLRRITDSRNAVYGSMETLMRDAFPPEEQRSAELQRRNVDNCNIFHCNAIELDNQFVGLLNYWDLDDLVYVEHFATLSERRGSGIGREALALLRRLTALPIILEVELPTDELTRRRICFYERCGFRLCRDFDYRQPPYDHRTVEIPMFLMINGEYQLTADGLRRAARLIYEAVYAR